MKKMIVLLGAILLSHTAMATNVTENGFTDSENNQIEEMAQTNPDQYEIFRKSMVEQAVKAQNYDMFLAWATPEEVDSDLGVDANEFLLDLSGGYTTYVTVHIGSQTMDAKGGGLNIHSRRVATGRPGYATRMGCHTAFKAERVHLSRQFHNFPLKNAIFFDHGDAFHIGNPSHRSHGCVHLDPSTSQQLFNAYHRGKMQVCVVR